MKIFSVVWVGLVAGLTLGACGDDDGGSGGLKTELYATLCEAQDDCCKASGEANSVSACKQFYTVLGAEASVDEAKTQACIAQIKAARSAGTFCGSDSDDVAPDCDGALVNKGDGGSSGGTKQPGETCSSSSECARVDGATDVTCARVFSSSPGGGTKEETYCEVTRAAAVGEACEDLPKGYEAECDEKAGAYCDYGTNLCALPKGEGEECSGSSQSCQKGLFCALSGQSYTCTKTLGEGEACDSFSKVCNDQTYCSSEGVCAAKLAKGAACTSSQSCQGGGCVNGVCDSSSSGGQLCFTSD